MKVSTFARVGVSITAAAALTAGLAGTAFATAVTAHDEDPVGTPAATTLVGVGSDTTQDVMYGVAQAINAGHATPILASYTATGGADITYRSGKNVARPNGSGAGYKALNDSIGLTSANLANAGDVDFARASGTQGVAAVTAGTGVTTDIPFAVDTMGIAVPASSPFLMTNDATGLTITDLYNIYTGAKTYINKTTGELVDTTTGTGAESALYEPIHAFVPKPGSGSRQFFLKAVASQGTGLDLGTNKGDSLFTSNGNPAAGAPYIGAKNATGGDVQEHDGTILTTEPSTVAAIAPFSGAKFIGYHNQKIADPDTGKTAGSDYVLVKFKSTVTGGEMGTLPYTDNGGTYAPNAAYITYAAKGTETNSFKLTRDVYNIIPTAAVNSTPGANAKYDLLKSTFVGSNSAVCQATAAITEYGFINKASGCGSTTLTFDATPSTSTTTVTPGTNTAGKPVAFDFDVASNGNGGGTITVTTGGHDYTGTIASGQHTGTVNVPTTAAGTFDYTATFVPNLAGVAASQAVPGTFTVSPAPVVTVVKVAAVVKAVAPKVKHTKKGKVTVTVTASGVVPTGTVTVVIKKKSTVVLTVAGKKLANGKILVVLPKKLKKGTYLVFVSYSGDAKVKAAPSAKLASLKVT